MSNTSVKYAEIAKQYEQAIACEKYSDEILIEMFRGMPAAALHMIKASICTMCKPAEEIEALKEEKQALIITQGEAQNRLSEARAT